MQQSLKTELIEVLTNVAMEHDERAIRFIGLRLVTKEEVENEQLQAKYIRQIIERVKEE